MHIQLLSDLHLEAHPDFQPVPAPGADVLVLAGDIGSYQNGSRLTSTDFGLERFSPLPQYAGWPTPVLLVPGNHEYDMQDFDAAHRRLQNTCERLGIIWLERQTVILSGVRFAGTTLWSDFDALAQPQDSAARNLKRRNKAFRAANYYLSRLACSRKGAPMLAPEVREQALACREWLAQALHRPYDGITVAVTHFAPSLRSADPRYGLVPGTAGFCNALDNLVPYADLWLHGHLHAPSDYMVQGLRHGRPAACRVVANPMGYANKNEHALFKPAFCIDTGVISPVSLPPRW